MRFWEYIYHQRVIRLSAYSCAMLYTNTDLPSYKWSFFEHGLIHMFWRFAVSKQDFANIVSLQIIHKLHDALIEFT